MKTKILVFLAALLLPVGVFAQSELKELSLMLPVLLPES